MTYIPNHVADGHQLTNLVGILTKDVEELCRMVDICADVADMPGQRPEGTAERTGGGTSAGPSRPTEEIALNSARLLLQSEITTSTAYMIHAIAYVRGVTAALDRALSTWEGEAPAEHHGGHDDGRPDGAAENT
ncbi:hypothetical protein GCM10009548_02300 [Streptomyces malaysiensis subsp. malaysiensis]|uniref:Uncharacterized protein n=1 Tax=Streptomyces malaysiensis TaxID=92644 RepID=A0ABX6W486_STRMQ|nr:MULTISPECIES: hypothetical protein [Streptomyces]QPI56310.1 hypothetical protein I1A49_16405 [Streptomyces solisilvae]UHH17794.1 hypothetical protein LUV23_16525 [Streptomyces sp. HNM0561]